MPRITPGIAALSWGFAYLFIYLGTFYDGTSHLTARLGFYIPKWIIVVGALVAAPALGRLYIFGQSQRLKRKAAALGARIVPRVRGEWIGNLDLVYKTVKNIATGYPGDDLIEPIEKYGPVITLSVMYSDLIMTTCPEHIKAILATDFQNYVKGERMHTAMHSVLGTGVFNSDGEMWKFHRSITRPVFTRERIADFDIFDRHAEECLHQLKTRLREGYAVDFQDLMARFTMDTATEFLFGRCVHTLSARLPYPHNASGIPAQKDSATDDAVEKFSKAFLQSQEAIATREKMTWLWPLFEILKDKTIEPMKIVNAYIEPIIQDSIEKKKTLGSQSPQAKLGEKEIQEDDTLLDHLINITQDPIVLRDEILNIMIAGRDTTASTLTFAVYLLSQNPEILARLRAEILDRVGPTRRPDFDDLKNLKFLRAVINETLRLFPAVPFNVRESVNEAVWTSPDPTQKPLYIAPGTKIAYSVFIMHRRKDLWGPDAEEFDPDRFLDERLQKYLLKNSFIFLPFNAGPRICLGQQYAYNEMSFILIRLLQSFSEISLDISSAPAEAIPPAQWAQGPGRKTTEKVRPKSHLTMYAGGGLWTKMWEADAN